MAADNKHLGTFDLVGIAPAPRGVPQIEVTFDIDANGIVNVSAKDKATNKEQSIRIQASGGLSDEDIDRMVKEAEEHAGEDKKRREKVEARNQLEALINSTESALKDADDKVDASVKSEVETAIAAAKENLESDETEELTAASQALAQAAMKIGEAMYGSAAGEASEQATSADASNDDENVVDADFEEVKDDDSKKSA
jgi:molecular chaperone DnaK